MRGIVEDLLALARADAGAREIEREPVRLDRVVAASCDEHAALAESRGIRLERDLEPGVIATGSPRFLARAVSNLLSNAIKFTPDGGTVTARVAGGPDGAEVSVSDTGPGIPPEHRARVFERFFRVGEGRDPAEGAGLGLSIVSWVVRQHGGTVSVDEAPGGGAAFRIRLPARPEPAGVQDPARSGV
jgi:signal transduction histidine kinase